MVLRKTGCNEIILDLFLSYILMKTRGPFMIVVGFWKILGVYFFYIQVIFVFRA